MKMQDHMTAQLRDAVGLAVAFSDAMPKHLEHVVAPLLPEDRHEHLSTLVAMLAEGRLVEKRTRDLLREANAALDEVISSGTYRVERPTHDVLWLREPCRVYETRLTRYAKAAEQARKPLRALLGQIELALSLTSAMRTTQELLNQ
ncbi:hypothetical protein [Tranquillimonas alkanivorans]|uniref:Uncharacterized protein n=1 Tax=Tranquillimonas alkanivorans TaxID=441119 RepID=A0A1I5R0H4_9RHOB|nr:hypothetical protein [Tranquillimonas alkanivorans]SFP51880.1 hypothetical protein SAMN04488047_107205 [Tranquillimonas alkanivorans]